MSSSEEQPEHGAASPPAARFEDEDNDNDAGGGGTAAATKQQKKNKDASAAEKPASAAKQPAAAAAGRTTKTAARARATALPEEEPPLAQLERVEGAARATAAERRAEAARKKREAEERFEAARVAAGPKAQALVSSHGRTLVPPLVSHGGGVLSGVDLCELAVVSKGFAEGAAAFWETCLQAPAPPPVPAAGATAATTTRTTNAPQPPAAATTTGAATTTTTNAPQPPASVTKLALEHDPAHAGKDHSERRARWEDPKIGCGCCGRALATAQTGIPPAMLDCLGHPICDDCFSGLTTTFPPSRGPRVLLAYSAGVLAPAVAQLYGASVEEVARSLPHHPRSRSRAFRAERGVRVSLRAASSFFLRKLGGPRRRAAAAELSARSQAASLAQLDVPRKTHDYEALDAAASERRKHRLRTALVDALASRVHERAPKQQPPGKIWRWTGGGTGPAGPPFDFGRDASADLKSAAAAYVAVGRPPISAIVAATVREVEAIEEKEGWGRKKRAVGEGDDEEDEGGGGSARKKGKKV